MKRIWSIILTLCLLAGMAPPWTNAAEVPTSGTCGDNLTWTLVNGVLTISGTGDMTDYANLSDVPWYDSVANIETVLMERGVTSIGGYAFYGCRSLTNVTIPDSVTYIGNVAFSGCGGLTSVEIPNSVTSIGERAFDSCSGLTSVDIPNSVTSIGERAFVYCSALTDINVSAGNNVYVSESGVLFNISRSSLICYPAGKTETAYVIPNSVTSIGDFAFYSCSGLTSVTIPSSVTVIDDYAFTISDDEEIEGLQDVYYNGTQAQWRAIAISETNDALFYLATIHCTDGDINGESSSDEGAGTYSIR